MFKEQKKKIIIKTSQSFSYFFKTSINALLLRVNLWLVSNETNQYQRQSNRRCLTYLIALDNRGFTVRR